MYTYIGIIPLYYIYEGDLENIIPCHAFKFISRAGYTAVAAYIIYNSFITAAHNYKFNFILFLFFSTSINNMLFAFSLHYNIIWVRYTSY